MNVRHQSKRWLRIALVALGTVLTTQVSSAASSGTDVLRATLRNGLRVVIVPNALAPVASVDLTYLAGSRDDPPSFPGMAHAQEHMMFRGTKNLSTSELGTLATALGGDFNASTSETTTQFQFTVPASDLDAVFRIESDRMRDVLDAQAQWENERGAIEQEVLRDESAPGADFFRDAQAIAYAGTPYAHDGVGTRAAFDRLTGPEIKDFYRRWYGPNNAVLVVAGAVDPAATLAQIRARFESLPERTIPAHAAARVPVLRRAVIQRFTTLVYPLALVGFRLPGIDSPDFLPSFVLQGILDSPRGPLHALEDTGEALDGEFVSFPYLPEGQLAFATAALRPGADPNAMTARLEGLMRGYAQRGVPRELFESTRRRLIADQELSRNSIEALASDWATTIALDREPSIAHEQDLIAAVTLAQVDEVAKRYLDPAHAIVGALTPSASASQNAPPVPPQGGPEKPLAEQPPVTELPAWADRLVKNIAVPAPSATPARMRLPNGITLIVVPETISDSVYLRGRVRTSPALQEPARQEGVSAVLNTTFEYGTRTRDRTAFQRAADDLEAFLSGGPEFGLQSSARSFERAVTLLAENELEPRFDEATFETARRRATEELATALNSASTESARRASVKLYPASDPDLRQSTVRTMEGLTLDDVRAYYAKTMRPDLTTIVVVGSITPAAARTAVEHAFGAWHAAGEPPALDLPVVPLNAPGEVRVTIPSSQDYVTLEHIVAVSAAAPQIYALEVGNAILGGGSLGPEQSRLFRDLRQNAGLVYSVDSRLSTQRSRPRFSIEFASLPANENRIVSLIEAEITRMKTEPVGDFELSLVKASLVRRTVIGDSSVASIASGLLDAASNGWPIDQGQIDAKQFLATDAKAVQQAFAAYIHPENFVRVIEGP